MTIRVDLAVVTPARYAWWWASCGMILLLGGLAIGCAAEPREPWLGIDLRMRPVVAGTRPASGPALPADHQSKLRLVSELGAPHLRVDLMDWARIQPRNDVPYNFSSSDRFVRLAQRHGMDILAVCAAVPAWAAAGPTSRLPAREHAEAFSAFVRAFVERYDGDGVRDMPGLRRPIRSFECFENPEGEPTPDYAFWLKRFHDAAKFASSKSIVVLGSLRCPGLQPPTDPPSDAPTYFERLLAEEVLQGSGGACFDVVGFSNYPRHYPGRPAFEHAVAYLRQALAARRLDRPIWLTAFGADSRTPEASGEDRQAADLLCWAIHGRSVGIDRLYQHTRSDAQPEAGFGPSEAFGLVREGEVPPSRKPAFHAVALLLDVLRAAPQVTRRADGIYMLSGDKEPTYVLWRVARYDPSSFLIPGWWEVRTLAGQRLVRQGADIQVTDQPIFLQRTRSPFIR